MKLLSAILLTFALVQVPAVSFACKDKNCECKHEGKSCGGDEKKSCGESCEGSKAGGKCSCKHDKMAGHDMHKMHTEDKAADAKADVKVDAKKDEKKK